MIYNDIETALNSQETRDATLVAALPSSFLPIDEEIEQERRQLQEQAGNLKSRRAIELAELKAHRAIIDSHFRTDCTKKFLSNTSLKSIHEDYITYIKALDFLCTRRHGNKHLQNVAYRCLYSEGSTVSKLTDVILNTELALDWFFPDFDPWYERIRSRSNFMRSVTDYNRHPFLTRMFYLVVKSISLLLRNVMNPFFFFFLSFGYLVWRNSSLYSLGNFPLNISVLMFWIFISKVFASNIISYQRLKVILRYLQREID